MVRFPTGTHCPDWFLGSSLQPINWLSGDIFFKLFQPIREFGQSNTKVKCT
jgi:hypothetical protein